MVIGSGKHRRAAAVLIIYFRAPKFNRKKRISQQTWVCHGAPDSLRSARVVVRLRAPFGLGTGVMTEFEFRRSSRQCSQTGQPIPRGEWFYSVLREQPDGTLVREDVLATAWTGPPPDNVGWWRSRAPDLEKGRVYWAPSEVLLSVFQHYLNQPHAADLAFVMALILVRKKILHIQEKLNSHPSGPMELVDMKTKQEYQVPTVSLPPQRVQEIQAELAEKLFTDQSQVSAESTTESEDA